MGKPAVIKTKITTSSVEGFINRIKDEQKRNDSLRLLELMRKVSGEKPAMWGNSIIGFGKKRYRSPTSGREVDWFKIGFAPRKANLSLHLVFDLQAHASVLKSLGKHKTGLGCLYINKLDDVDLEMLENIMHASMKDK